MPKGVPIRIFHATTAGALPPAGSLTEGELALDALSNPPRLWTQVPTSRDPSGRIDLLADGAPTLPLSIANGGTGATTEAGALNSLSGSSGSMAGALSRSALGVWSLTTAAGGATVSATAPVSPTEGDLWFDTTDTQLYVRFGTAWVVAVNLIGPDTSLDGGIW